MVHLENKLEWCIRKAKKEGEKHRGLKEIKPDEDKANRHIAKAEHNRKAMSYLIVPLFIGFSRKIWIRIKKPGMHLYCSRIFNQKQQN